MGILWSTTLETKGSRTRTSRSATSFTRRLLEQPENEESMASVKMIKKVPPAIYCNNNPPLKENFPH